MKKKVLMSIFALIIGAAGIQNGFSEEATTLAGFKPYVSIQGNIDYVTASKEIGAGGEEESDLGLQLTDAIMGVEYQKDNMAGTFELVLADDNLAEVGLAFAEFDFGSFNFMIGLNDSPYTFNSNEVSFSANNLIGFGTTTEDAGLLMAQVGMKGFYLNVMETHLPTNDAGDNEIGGNTVADYEVLLPKTVIGYSYESDAFSVGLGGAINTFKVNDAASAIDNKSITSYLGFIHGTVNAGNFSLLANFGYSVNANEFGLAHNVDSALVVVGDEIKDTTSLEGYVEAGYSLGSVDLKAGIGYVQSDNDTFTDKDQAMAYYLQSSIAVNDYITVVPEIAVHDNMKDKDGNDQGSEISAGAFIEVAF